MIRLGRSLYIIKILHSTILKSIIILQIVNQYFDIHPYFEIINIFKIVNTLLNFVNTGAGAGTLSLHEYKYPDKVHRDGFLKYFHKLYLLLHSICSKKTGKIGLLHTFLAFFSNIVVQRSKDGQGVPGSLKLLQQHQVSSYLCEL